MRRALCPKELLLLPVRWRRVRDGHWSATVNDRDCSLRMNDFPEEPLYTVTVEGVSIDIDDAPRTWSIE
jgi:hypothetical protein